MIELKVDFFASSVCIKPAIWNNNLNRFSFCDMVFDTGASMTTIDTSIAIRAEYKVIVDFKDKRSKPDKRDATIFLDPTFDINRKFTCDNFIPSESRFGIWRVVAKSKH